MNGLYGRLARWLNVVADYKFTIVHGRGAANVPADYFSPLHFVKHNDEGVTFVTEEQLFPIRL